MFNQHKKSQEITIREISTMIKAVVPSTTLIAAQHLFDRKVEGVDISILGSMGEGHTLIFQMNDGKDHGLFEISLDQVLKNLVADFKAQVVAKNESDDKASNQAKGDKEEATSLDDIQFDDFYPSECCSCGRPMQIAPSRAHKLGLFNTGLTDCRECHCVMNVKYDPAANKLIPSIKTH